QGKYAEAEPLYARCQAIQEKVLGPEHPDYATTLRNRAVLLKSQHLEGNVSPSFWIRTCFNLDATALSTVFHGTYAEAQPLHQRCLAIDEKVYDPDHPQIAADLNNWAVLLESR
ncbi:unnamed protein product, partial [Scytosiphon promiscuus]